MSGRFKPKSAFGRIVKKARRKCGACSACCTVVKVETIGKEAREACPKALAGGGCSVYDDRPAECAHYTCWWREGLFMEDERPDLVGALVEGRRDRLGLRVAVVRETEAGQLEQGKADGVINATCARLGFTLVDLAPREGDSGRRSRIVGREDKVAAYLRAHKQNPLAKDSSLSLDDAGVNDGQAEGEVQ